MSRYLDTVASEFAQNVGCFVDIDANDMTTLFRISEARRFSPGFRTN